MVQFFLSKASMPRAGRLISRPRLVRMFTDGVDARLVLVAAPAGFGKTTAVVDWLTHSEVDRAWLSLDADDNDLSKFLRYLWTAIVGSPSRPGRAGSGPPDAAEAIGEIVAVLARGTAPAVIVLDDFHVIVSAQVQGAVRLLLEHLPDHVRLVVVGRHDPALPLSLLRARAQLLEVRADALAFTDEETGAFLRERMGLDLSRADVTALGAGTEGWPAVLQLAGVWLSGTTATSARVRELAASNRFVLDFVSDEVLSGLPAATVDFLLRTSLLERLTGGLCDAVTGRDDGRAMLEYLDRSNLLVQPLEEGREWYRYHRLFADVLRARLSASRPDELPVLQRRAAGWYDEHGYAADAIEHALSCGDWEFASGLLAKASAAVIHAAEYVTLLGWLDRLPVVVLREDSLLSTRYAWALALTGRVDEVERRLADAEEALPRAQQAGRPDVVSARSQFALIRSVVARTTGDGAAAVAHARDALREAPADLAEDRRVLLNADAQALLGHALWAVGDVDGAMAAYRTARPLLQASGNWIGLADIARNQARLEVGAGRLRQALAECHDALGPPDHWAIPALAPVHLARAEVLHRLRDPDAAAAAELALTLARDGGDTATAHDARLLLERLTREPPPDAQHAQGETVAPLTQRELEVLRLTAAGRSNRQIATELYLALGTVKSHLHAIAGKLGAANRVEAVAIARRSGLLP